MKSFWEIDDEGYYTLKKITAEEVAKAEDKLGVTLPDTYKKLILEQNGGYTVHNAFPTTHSNSWVEDHIQFNHLLGIAEDEGIMDSAYLIKEWELPEGLVLINGDGHTWVAMDYRKTKENPAIHYFDVEMEEDFKLADSFDEFIQGLYTVKYTVDEEAEAAEGEYELSEVHLSKEELEAIFELDVLDEGHLYKIQYYPMVDLKEIEWFFKKMQYHIENTKDEDALYQVADTILCIFLLNQNMPINEKISEILHQIAKFLEKNDDPLLVNLGENIAIGTELLS
ncbi:SMI1/KNR4 family protein [Bacillus altitudinis]|uniref:SMI1/KNR4 family protein n=4 Tax=Bacillus altitudinis TaxID=293387 RepID=UPI00061A448E|nr:SMI1/KNR4 family protein [Bacillus altitudinis]AKC65609.1 SMI1 / KNR4 family protein [Bacillus altitudinis]MCY7498268.1 SMI1/KNR4 family protein [Bacillus altitudinis]MCY7535485.1 SMI1/KNR4 family protein [Bacillus altitudinis]MCY7545502.1 SMI1/KNR4 family protein [Bacillus altitudinis]MCY7553602.1 SMI1/KNR4 family protein [Bacillus altitudinis]